MELLDITSWGAGEISLLVGALALFLFRRHLFAKEANYEGERRRDLVGYSLPKNLYGFFYLLLYFALFSLLTLLPKSEERPVTIAEQLLRDPFALLFLLGVILPKTFPFSRFDRSLVESLQRVGSLHRDALCQMRVLLKSNLALAPAERERVVKKAERRGADHNSIKFDDQGVPKDDWSRLTSLIYGLEKWKEKHPMAKYMNESSEIYRSLKERYFSLIKEKERLSLSNRFFPQDHEKAQDSLRHFIQDIEKGVSDLYQRLCHFIAEGVVHRYGSMYGRERSLRELGFQLPDHQGFNEVNPDNALFRGGKMFVISSLLAIFLARWKGSSSLLEGVVMVFFSSLLFFSFALLFKGRFSHAERSLEGKRPFLYYFFTATCVTILLAIIRSLIGYQPLSLYLLFAFVGGLFTAMIHDDLVLGRERAFLGRVMEKIPPFKRLYPATRLSVGEGIAFALFSLISLSLSLLATRGSLLLSYTAVIIALSTIAAFVYAFYLPQWYRDRRLIALDELERELNEQLGLKRSLLSLSQGEKGEFVAQLEGDRSEVIPLKEERAFFERTIPSLMKKLNIPIGFTKIKELIFPPVAEDCPAKEGYRFPQELMREHGNPVVEGGN